MYHFIINPSSKGGKGIKLWQIIEEYLINHQIKYSYYFTNPKVSETEVVCKINNTPEQSKKIVVLGGDGTINGVINGLTDEELDNTYIGYIPTGSSNDLARSLKLSKDPLIRLKEILSSTTCLELDIGKLKLSDKELRFAVSSGSGFDASICKFANGSKIKKIFNHIGLSKFVYIIKAVSALFKSPYSKGSITVDNKKSIHFDKGFFIISMIHKYEGGGIGFAPSADPADGLLSVCIAHSMSRFQLLIMLLHVLVGKHQGLKGVELFNCSSMSVSLENNWELHTDGEDLGSYNTYEVSCLPKKLKLLV